MLFAAVVAFAPIRRPDAADAPGVGSHPAGPMSG